MTQGFDRSRSSRIVKRLAGVGTGAALLAAIAVAVPLHAQGDAASPKPRAVVKGAEYTLEQWADGVYFATGGSGSQNCIVVGEEDVLLFDSGTTPGSARALLADLKLVTNKPVKTVVNSHFHYDHVNGNAAFGPGVEIISHKYTQTAIKTFDTLHREPYLSWANRTTPAQVEALTRQVAAETDPQRKAMMERQLGVSRRDAERKSEVVPTPPTRTFDTKLAIQKGSHDVQLLFLGRAHTAGDIVLFLPKEKLVCSGDMIEEGISYLGDGYYDEWVKALEALKQLDWQVTLPGHGRPFAGKDHVTHLQTYLTDLVGQVERIRSQNVPAEEALKRLDLSAHEKNWPPRLRPVDLRSMLRIYEWLEERAAR